MENVCRRCTSTGIMIGTFTTQRHDLCTGNPLNGLAAGTLKKYSCRFNAGKFQKMYENLWLLRQVLSIKINVSLIDLLASPHGKHIWIMDEGNLTIYTIQFRGFIQKRSFRNVPTGRYVLSRLVG